MAQGGPAAPPSAVVSPTFGIFRAEDYGASSSKDDSSGGINLAAAIASVTGGGVVQLDSGKTYRVRRTVQLPSNVELVIPTGTTLQAAAGLVGDVVASAAGASTGIGITGGGTIDGNRAGGANGNGITLTGISDAWILGVQVVNAYADGVALVNCTRSLVDVMVGANGRHGIYHSGSTFCTGRVIARDNGQRIAGSGLAFDAASTDNAYAPVVATDTRVGGAKTQQYGVLEVAASGADRNTYAAFSLGGNATGASSLVGPGSGPAAGAPTGAAGGALAGNYPNPTLVPNSVGAGQLANGAVGTTQLANGAVGTTQLAAGAATQAASAVDNTAQSTTSTSYVDVPGMSVTLTTLGGDLLVTATTSALSNNTANSYSYLALVIDGGLAYEAANISVGAGQQGTVAMTWRVAAPAAGSHTIKLQFKAGAGTSTLNANWFRSLVVEEIKR